MNALLSCEILYNKKSGSPPFFFFCRNSNILLELIFFFSPVVLAIEPILDPYFKEPETVLLNAIPNL